MEPTGVQNAFSETAESQMVTGSARLKSFSMAVDDATSTDTSVRFRNGTTVSDEILLEVSGNLSSAYTNNMWVVIPGNGIRFDSGIFVDMEGAVSSVSIMFQGE